MGRFGQRGHRLSGGASAASPLPALAAGQVEVSKRAGPSPRPCCVPSIHDQGEEAPATGSTGLLRSFCIPVPCLGIAGKENCSPIPPPLHRGEDQGLLPGAETFTIAFGPAAEILPFSLLCRGGGRRSGGSVPGPAAKLAGGLHGASKRVRRSGPAW